MKTNELTGAALDWAVAKCEGATDEWRDDGPFWWDGVPCIRSGGHDVNYRPSSEWWLGGPIIDREDIAMSSTPDGLWAAYVPKGTRLVQHAGQAVEVFNWTYKQQGYSPLIAAMRCYVASKLGDDIDLPKELT